MRNCTIKGLGSNRKCIITDLDISMQKENSFLLSHEGLNYYFGADMKTYNEVKRKYLSEMWEGANHKTQVKEIAHNIRNTISNRRIKQRKLYPVHQPTLFTI